MRYVRAIHRTTGERRCFRDQEHAASTLDTREWALEDRYDPAWGLPAAMLPDRDGRPFGHPEHRPPRMTRNQRRTHG